MFLNIFTDLIELYDQDPGSFIHSQQIFLSVFDITHSNDACCAHFSTEREIAPFVIIFLEKKSCVECVYDPFFDWVNEKQQFMK